MKRVGRIFGLVMVLFVALSTYYSLHTTGRKHFYPAV